MDKIEGSGDYFSKLQEAPKFLPHQEVDKFEHKHLGSGGLSQVPTRQTLSPYIPHNTKIALFKQEIENQKQHLAMKDNYIDFRKKHFKNELKIKDEELLRTNIELIKAIGEKGRMKELLVEEQKATRQLQEEGRKQQAVVEELLRKDLWNQEQKLLREAEIKKKNNVIQNLTKHGNEEESVIDQQHMLEQQLVSTQEYIEEQQFHAPINCQLGLGVAGSHGQAHCRLVDKLLAWGQLPGLSSSDCSRLVMKLRAERGGLSGLAMGVIEGEVGRLGREEEGATGGAVGRGK